MSLPHFTEPVLAQFLQPLGCFFFQECAPEVMPKHRKCVPNRRLQSGAFGAAPLGSVVFDLAMISYVWA